MTTTESLDNAPAPRLCHVVRWPDFEGYGFNLHSDKVRNAQFIGKVDENSPAEAAGLIKGDRIVEVNGINIANENHKQVVERIKAVPNETRLLVVDPAADIWFREHKEIITGTLKNIIFLQNPTKSDLAPEYSTTIVDVSPVPSELPVASKTRDRKPSFNDDEPEPPKPKSDSIHLPGTSFVELECLPPPPAEVTEGHISHTADEEIIQRIETDRRPSFPEARIEAVFQAEEPVFVPQPQPIEVAPVYPLQYDIPESEMKEVYTERTVSVVRDDTADELASQLVNFRVLPDGTRAPSSEADVGHVHPEVHERKVSSVASGHDEHSSHVHFELHNGQHGSPIVEHRSSVSKSPSLEPRSELSSTPSFGGHEVVTERVEHSPAFERAESSNSKEEIFEKVEVHRHEVPAKRQSVDQGLRRKTSESVDSGSNSLSSVENIHEKASHDEKHNGDTFSNYDENKTPSPSPAVIPESPVNHKGRNGGYVPLPDKPMTEFPVQDKPQRLAPIKPVNANTSGLTALDMSAQEMRATLARRRKVDVRSQNMDARKKHELINNL